MFTTEIIIFFFFLSHQRTKRRYHSLVQGQWPVEHVPACVIEMSISEYTFEVWHCCSFLCSPSHSPGDALPFGVGPLRQQHMNFITLALSSSLWIPSDSLSVSDSLSLPLSLFIKLIVHKRTQEIWIVKVTLMSLSLSLSLSLSISLSLSLSLSPSPSPSHCEEDTRTRRFRLSIVVLTIKLEFPQWSTSTW